jgi:hypothetical protein
VALSQPIDGIVTHYGIAYAGNVLGCGGRYTPEDTTIAAVGGRDDGEWPCGTLLQVCGAAGCLFASRQDSCPGCGPGHVDLSEAGIGIACGPGADVCDVRIQAFRASEQTANEGQRHAEERGDR